MTAGSLSLLIELFYDKLDQLDLVYENGEHSRS